MRERRIERNARIFISLVFVPFLILALLRFSGEVLPFAPYVVSDFPLERAQGCPGEEVLVSVDRSIRKPAFGKVDDVAILTAWRPEGGGKDRLPRNGFSVFPGVYGSDVVPGTTPRSTPKKPGVYRLVAVVTVRGKVLGQNRAQTFPETVYGSYTVLAPGEGGCPTSKG